MKTPEEISKLTCTEYTEFVMSELIPAEVKLQNVCDLRYFYLSVSGAIYCRSIKEWIIFTQHEKAILAELILRKNDY
jgi:hypothetical protein